MRARIKGRSDQALAVGWHGEAFARTKRMLPLQNYIEPSSEASKRDKDAGDLRQMIQRMLKKQESENGAR